MTPLHRIEEGPAPLDKTERAEALLENLRNGWYDDVLSGVPPLERRYGEQEVRSMIAGVIRRARRTHRELDARWGKSAAANHRMQGYTDGLLDLAQLLRSQR